MSALQPLITVDKWNIIKKIGSGGSSQVFLAEDKNSRERVALKIYEKNQQTISLNTAEYEIQKSLDHPGILTIYSYSDRFPLFVNQNNIDDISFLVTEYADRGDLFSLVEEYRIIPERLARTIFCQLIEAIEYLKSQDVVHGDIKMENILLTKDYKPKIGDFGSAIKGSYKSTKKRNSGTTGYLPPEVISGKDLEGKNCDLFGAAIILFIMLTGHVPFREASYTDPTYSILISRDYAAFWNIHRKITSSQFGHDNLNLSYSVMELITSMLDSDPNSRPCIDQIKEYDWFNGSRVDEKEIHSYISELQIS